MAARAALYDGCPSAHALDLIGDRWALLIVRDLLLGPKRFTDLLRGLPRISRNVLSQRLDDLEAAGVLTRRRLAAPTAASVYELTPRGLELESVLTAIGRWGADSPTLPPTSTLGVDTFVLGLRDHYDSEAGADLTFRFELVVGQDAFGFLVEDGALTVRRGSVDHPDAVLEVDPAAMAAVARGVRALAKALRSPEGNAAAVRRFAGLFRRPARLRSARATR